MKSGAKMDLTMKQIKMFFQERSLEGIKPGLKRMKQLLSFVDNPEKDVEFIHVTGTNGKGSTVQYIKQGLLANQIKDRKSTRLNSSHVAISYAVFCLKKKK